MSRGITGPQRKALLVLSVEGKDTVFKKSDVLFSVIAGLTALFFYWASTMPEIGMGDEGEMTVAARLMGVMHPSGYPLWTILAFVTSHMIPIGSDAFRVALFSGIAGGLSVSFFALVAKSYADWVSDKKNIAVVLASLATFTFMVVAPVWSQATIGKGTYALHVAILMALVVVCYKWIRRPNWDGGIFWSLFIISLGMSNHHMTLAVAPIPVVLLLVLRRDVAAMVVTYLALILSWIYLGFGWLSKMPEVVTASRRFAILAAIFFVARLVWGYRNNWRWFVKISTVVVIGLLPYLYMPLASSTNPPADWSLTRTKAGFFASVNRSQYWGTLADKLQSTIGRVVLAPQLPKKKGFDLPDEEASGAKTLGFMRVFWREVMKNASPMGLVGVILFLAAIIRESDKEKKAWYFLLLGGFLLTSFMEPLMNPDRYDRVSWETHKPWFGISMGFYLMMALGGVLFLAKKRMSTWAAGILGLGALVRAFMVSEPVSNHAGDRMGKKYGDRLLEGIPEGSIYFGGTDPGWFVPMYMANCAQKQKIYVMSQARVADPIYAREVRGKYGVDRPITYNWIERQMGRPSQYPHEELVLPDVAGLKEALSSPEYTDGPAMKLGLASGEGVVREDSAVVKWIVQKNKQRHRIFVEESFVMPWTYAYARPHGLCYEIEKSPVVDIPQKSVEVDMARWEAVIKELEGDSHFAASARLRLAYSKDRVTTANIYLYHGMNTDAVRVLRQAVRICPYATEANYDLAYAQTILCDYTGARQGLEEAVKNDPENRVLKDYLKVARLREDEFDRLPLLLASVKKDPRNESAALSLIQAEVMIGNEKSLKETLADEIKAQAENPDFLVELMNIFSVSGKTEESLMAAEALTKNQPGRWDAWYARAKYESRLGEKDKAIESINKAVKNGGDKVREKIAKDPDLKDLSPVR